MIQVEKDDFKMDDSEWMKIFYRRKHKYRPFKKSSRSQHLNISATMAAIVTMYCLVLLHMAKLNEGIVNNLKRCQSKGVLAKMQFSSNVSTKSESSKAHSISANYNR